MSTLNAFFLKSLRGRYAVVATILTLTVVAGAVFADRFMTAMRSDSTDNIALRNELLTDTRHVRDAIWLTRESLAGFLLDPQKKEHQRNIDAGIQQARQSLTVLRRTVSEVLPGAALKAEALDSAIEALNDATRAVIAKRLNPLEQYPTMAITSSVMLPLNREFYTAISLAMEELENSGNNVRQSNAYRSLVTTRHLWTQMVSQFRMYLANRMGSFSIESLAVQEEDVEQLYAGLMRRVDELTRLKDKGELGFQGEESLPILVASAARWRSAFDKIKQLNATDAWRADAQLMKVLVEPSFAKVWKVLVELDTAIEQRADVDVKTLTDAAHTQTNLFWWVTALCVAFILIGYMALESMVLRPLARVSSALKAEASGAAQVDMRSTSTIETQDLLDAFDGMRKQVHSRQAVLEHQALHDALTGLANRTLMIDRMQHAIHTAKRKTRSFAVMMLDLDRFKEINDTLGHEMGDRLLREVAARMQAQLRNSDTIARFGGDEFCVLLDETDELYTQHVTERIIGVLEEPVVIDDKNLLIGVSVGVALYPLHGDTPQTLIQRADVAMYVAKRTRSGYSYYDVADDKYSEQRLVMVNELREAISAHTLELFYQPKLSIATGHVESVEALLRWHHPQQGLISPDQIIPVAEQTGLIRPLTRWVLDAALTQVEEWKSAGINMRVAVNLSMYCLLDNELGDWMQSWFATHRATPADLILEVTESAMMSNPEKAVGVLTRFGEMGIGISVDDFGTGFSSLSYLKKLPLDELKIDRSFIIDMLNDENDAVIVRSTIDLAHNLGLKIVAEGVEDQDMLDLLEMLGCDYAQGYYISRPAAAPALTEWYRVHQFPVGSLLRQSVKSVVHLNYVA